MIKKIINYFLSANKNEEELQKAKEELQSANEQLLIARDELWGEMELAKRIQKILLPQKPEIDGYEISVHLTPAPSVGGDYYDILHIGGRDWIVIGDVAGYGVPSGLVLMMVQTSMHVALNQNPDLTPEELLVLINKSLSSSIKMLGEDRYMKLTILACLEDGRLLYSGLHQDMFIYRSGLKDIELVETRGCWIGIVDDIEGMLIDEELTLEKGDLLLLYTDGITESIIHLDKEDSGGLNVALFGTRKLAEILKRNGEKPPDLIKNAILEELKEYECRDDVALVILKRIE